MTARDCLHYISVFQEKADGIFGLFCFLPKASYLLLEYQGVYLLMYIHIAYCESQCSSLILIAVLGADPRMG